MKVQTNPKIHAWLAQLGLGSRRAMEALIERRAITVNDKLATIGQRINPNLDTIKVNGKLVGTPTNREYHYILVNKPTGVVSTKADEHGRATVLSLLPSKYSHLFPVGRLDKDSQGLMLLTNDGNLTYRLTHPKFQVPKTYLVTADRSITERALHFITKGIRLSGGWVQPIEVALIPDTNRTQVAITITDGKNHEIRRIMERAGYDTKVLVRTELGPFTLEELNGRDYVVLSSVEVKRRCQAILGSPSTPPTP